MRFLVDIISYRKYISNYGILVVYIKSTFNYYWKLVLTATTFVASKKPDTHIKTKILYNRLKPEEAS